MAHYQIISGAGATLGVYEASTPREAVEAMWSDAGFVGSDADYGELTVRELTAREYLPLGSLGLDLLAPDGHPVSMVDIDQDWDAETTTVAFPDGTRLAYSGNDVEVV